MSSVREILSVCDRVDTQSRTVFRQPLSATRPLGGSRSHVSSAKLSERLASFLPSNYDEANNRVKYVHFELNKQIHFQIIHFQGRIEPILSLIFAISRISIYFEA